MNCFYLVLNRSTNEEIDRWVVNDPMHLSLLGHGDKYTTNNGKVLSIVADETVANVMYNNMYKILYTIEHSVGVEKERKEHRKYKL